MSASIVIGSISVASGARILNGTLTGGSGSYSPASGASGLTVRQTSGTATTFEIASVVITSGGAVTITLGPFIPAGATIVVDLASGSTITDGSGNTCTGQTDVAVTNANGKTCSTYAYNDSGVANHFTTTDANGTIARVTELLATGTDVNLTVTAFGGRVYADVDGGAIAAVGVATMPSSFANFTIALLAGASAAQHDIVWRMVGNGWFQGGVTYTIANATAVAPSKPARAGTDQGLAGTAVTNVQLDNVPVINGAGFGGAGNVYSTIQCNQLSSCFRVRFRARISSLRPLLFNVNSVSSTIYFELRRRAVESTGAFTVVGSVLSFTNSLAVWEFGPTFSGLDNSTEWEYVLSCSNGLFWCIGFDALGVGVTATALSALPFMFGGGDSKMANYQAGTNYLANAFEGHLHQIAMGLGYLYDNWGLAGWTLKAGASSWQSSGTTTLINARWPSVKPVLGVFEIGINDNINESTGDSGAFQSAGTTLLGNFKSTCPGMKFLQLGIPASNNSSGTLPVTSRPYTDAAHAAAVAAQSSSDFAFYSLCANNVTNALVAPTALADTSDGIHFTALAAPKIAAAVIPQAQAMFASARARRLAGSSRTGTRQAIYN